MFFTAADLRGANFGSASLISGNWREPGGPAGATFSFVDGRDCVASHDPSDPCKPANLQDADFTSAYLHTSGYGSLLNFHYVDLQRATFTDASLFASYFGTTDFSEADLRDASFTSAWLEAASYGNLYFNGADLREANFESASLRADYGGKLHFSPADWDWTGDWGGRANLQDVDFTSADLRAGDQYSGEISFNKANLQRATLTDASLTAINNGAIEFSGADFDDASFTSAYLDANSYGTISFNGAEIRGATFKDASLYARYGAGDPVYGENTGEIILGCPLDVGCPDLDEKEETDFTGVTIVSEGDPGVVGCVINACSTHGSFDGTYHCEYDARTIDYVSNTNNAASTVCLSNAASTMCLNNAVDGPPCDADYCNKYLPAKDGNPAGEYHGYCVLLSFYGIDDVPPFWSAERCQAEVECLNTCLTGLPSCP